MLLKKLLLIPFLLSLNSCASSPPVPEGTIWSLTPHGHSAVGVPFNNRDVPLADSVTQSIDLMENYVCFSSDDWAGIEYYIAHLRNHQCQ